MRSTEGNNRKNTERPFGLVEYAARLSMILLDTFPAVRFQLRSLPQDLLARVLKIHCGLSQSGVLLLHCLRYLNVERIDAAAQLVD